MGERVLFVDLKREHASLADDMRTAFERVRENGSFILGEEVEAFEREYADYCGSRYCVGLASGTAALSLALIAAGIGSGDEVIVPAHTYIATALGVLHAGAKPVFCDVEDGSGLISLGSAESVISRRTTAILPVHLYGQMCDMDAVGAFARRHEIAVVEDAAQAHGATSNGLRAGATGLAACFSFYPSKNLGALGDGGAVCTNDGEIAERIRELRHLGQRRKGEHVVAGFNERLDGLQAALLRLKLPHLDRWNATRRDHAGAYRAALAGRVGLLEERPGASCVYHLFPIRVESRDDLARALEREGVQTGVHYTPIVPSQPPFAGSAREEAFPAAASWAREELSLPMFPSLRGDEIDRAAAACLDHAHAWAHR